MLNVLKCHFQKTVVMTKSVEYMPFFLSFFLFLNGGTWAFYALLVHDYFVGVSSQISFSKSQYYPLISKKFFYVIVTVDPGMESEILVRGGLGYIQGFGSSVPEMKFLESIYT